MVEREIVREDGSVVRRFVCVFVCTCLFVCVIVCERDAASLFNYV